MTTEERKEVISYLRSGVHYSAVQRHHASSDKVMHAYHLAWTWSALRAESPEQSPLWATGGIKAVQARIRRCRALLERLSPGITANWGPV